MSTGVEPRLAPATDAAAQLPIVVDDPVAQRFRVHRSAMTSPEIHRAEASGSSPSRGFTSVTNPRSRSRVTSSGDRSGAGRFSWSVA